MEKKETGSDYNNISFNGFTGRTEELKKVKRFSFCKIMMYQTDLDIHSQRVFWIAEALLPFAVKSLNNFDPEKARTLALVHDDAEIVTGDVQLGDKLKMTSEQLQTVHDNEAEAVLKLSERFPKTINNYRYQELLNHALHKDCIEAQFVSYCDKLDAFGETLHEIHAGNEYFSYPVQVYTKIINLKNFTETFPALTSLFKCSHPALQPEMNISTKEILKAGMPHTPESLQHDSGIAFYEFWKQLAIDHGRADLLFKD